MKKILTITGICFAALLLAVSFTACNADLLAPKGTITLSLTDAPIDAANVSGVYITIQEIQYNRSMDGQADEGSWVVMEEFAGPAKYNLLDLTEGESEMLGTLQLPAGQYNQIRFMLDIPDMGQNALNPGCYIEYNDGTTDALFIPSGGRSGYKAVGAFQVPVNGTVGITADFDVRKAVVSAGASGKFILKPTIRLVVDNEAGRITGSVNGYTAGKNLIVYAYENDAYTVAEAADPAVEESRFPNAVTSSKVSASGEYGLWYLAALVYDLVVAEYEGDQFLKAAELAPNVTVEAGANTAQTIDASTLN